MPSYSRLDNCRNGKNVMLALLLALTIPAPLLLAGDDGRNNDRGRFVDPIIGSWIIHIHVTAITPSSPLPPDFENITAFGKMVSPQVQIPMMEPLMASGESWDL
jgi:hypothetical protein